MAKKEKAVKVVQPKYHSISQQNSFRTIGALTIFTILAIFVLYPLIAAFLASFRPGQELIRYGLNLKLDFKSMNFNNYI